MKLPFPIQPPLQLCALALISLFSLTAATAYPTFKLNCAKGNTPAQCLNQTVTLEARMAGYDKSPASTIMEHPDMLPPIGTWYQDQTMISTNLGQMNVISKQAIKCPKVSLVGRLTYYKMTCRPGQAGNCNYASYVITVDKFTCLK